MRPKISGFALAGLQSSSQVGSKSNKRGLNAVKKQNSTDSNGSGGSGDGISTPRAGSPGQ